MLRRGSQDQRPTADAKPVGGHTEDEEVELGSAGPPYSSNPQVAPQNAAVGRPNESTTWWSDLFMEYSPLRTDGDMHYYVNSKFFAVLLAGLIIVASCVPTSFHYVDYYEYALRRDNYGGVQLTPTYTQGRYFETLNYGYVMFPSTYQAVDFQSTVFADNGMEFELHVRFYYRIPPERVGIIYDRYSKSYPSRIENNGKKIIKNVCTGFQVEAYMSNRSLIEDLIAGNISQVLTDVVSVEVPESFVKIIDIVFPASLIATSLDSALALQQNEVNQITQVVQLLQATTTQLVAAVEADKELLLQNADNRARQIVDTARAQASNVVNSARAVGMTGMFDALNITEPVDVAALVDAMALYDTTATAATIMSGVTGGAVVSL